MCARVFAPQPVPGRTSSAGDTPTISVNSFYHVCLVEDSRAYGRRPPRSPPSSRRHRPLDASNSGELLGTHAEHRVKVAQQLTFANIDLGGKLADPQLRIPSQESCGPGRDRFSLACAQICKKEFLHVGKPLSAGPCMRCNFLQPGYLARREQLVKPDLNIEEIQHALTEKIGGRLSLEAYRDHAECSARLHDDETAVQFGRTVAAIRLARGLGSGTQSQGRWCAIVDKEPGWCPE